MTSIAQVIDELQRKNNIDKQPINACLIEYRGQVWKLEKIKGGDIENG